MKNIFGTQEEIKLYDKNSVLRYKYSKDNYNYLKWSFTFDSNGKILTRINSDGYWCKRTRDKEGNELTYENSNGVKRGFDTSEYIMDELTKMIGK